MGIKFELHSRQLPKPYRDLPLKATTKGCSASVYHLGEDAILKIFEPGENTTLERTLYRHLKALPVPQPLAYFTFKDREALLFPKLTGKHPNTPSGTQLHSIGRFLHQLHTTNTDTLTLPARYSHSMLYRQIEQSHYPPLLHAYHTLALPELQENILIHGDLFRDNALFEEERLSGIIDWSDAALGDPLFDLAVVALDWCFTQNRLDTEKLSTLIHSYRPSLQQESLLPYIRYALLYYATTRYLAQGNYTVLLERLERLHA